MSLFGSERNLLAQLKRMKERLDRLEGENSKLKKENAKLEMELNLATIREDSERLNSEESSPPNEETPTSQSGEAPALDEEQKAAYELMEGGGNLFITGKAGTGKSYLLRHFVNNTRKKTLKMAPTGIAALNIGGVTLHSALGFGNLAQTDVDDLSERTLRLKQEKKLVLRNLDTIIIDEISMVRSDVFEKVDRILRIVTDSPHPFGGKQVIVFGDLFQLPPVVKGNDEQKFLEDRFGGVFFFHTKAYAEGGFKFIELTINHRQSEDKAFFEILNRIREGEVLPADVATLNSRLEHDPDKLRRVLRLFPRKADVDEFNRAELAKIESKLYRYDSEVVKNERKDQTPNFDAIFPIADHLKLKVGAMVMMVENDMGKRWVNGTLGIVSSLSPDRVMVTINGREFEVTPSEFSEQECVYKDGKMTYRDVLTVRQYPLVPAYAITIHKSQGMTYQEVACDISSCFASGQAYVALSRCSSLKGLHLLSDAALATLKTDSSVIAFYRNVRKTAV